MRLTDMGVSFVSKEREVLKPGVFYAYLLVGTGMYMAPEVAALGEVPNDEHRKWRAADPEEQEGIHTFYGPAVDWYAVGLLAYEMAATFFGPRGRKSESTFKLDFSERKLLLATWNATIENEKSVTSKEIGMTAWNDFMQRRNVPEQLWSLLWKLLHTVVIHRATFKDVTKNAFFQEGRQSLFKNLAEASFDAEKRIHHDTPKTLTDSELQVLLKDSISLTSTHPDFLWKGRTSWIDPNSDLFKCLREMDSDDEDDGESDNEY